MKRFRGFFAVLPFLTSAQTEGDIAYDYDDAYSEGDYEEVLGLDPTFDVPLVNVTVVAGQSALLPCSINDIGKYKVAWTDKSQNTLTFEERRIIDDSRISIVRPFVHAWNLLIRDVKSKDQGAYLCTLNTQPVKSKTAMLFVKVPPEILDSTSSNDITAQEGDTVVLICNVTGDPTPTVTWYRSPATRPYHSVQESKGCDARAMGPGIGLTGEMIIINNVSRYCDDIYECRARNGVLPDVARQIRVTVEYPPEIRMPVEAIMQKKGRETILECKITGHPLSMTLWQRNGVEIQNNAKFRTEVYDDDDSRTAMSFNLHIKRISQEDFGEYTCVAKNAHGEAYGKILLKEISPNVSPPKPTTTKYIPVVYLDKSTTDVRPNYQKDHTTQRGIAPGPLINSYTSSQAHNAHVSQLTLWSTLFVILCARYYQSHSGHL